MKQQIIKNISSNYLVTFFGMVLGFLLIPFLIRKLGRDAFGLIVLAESTIAFFEIVTISVRIALSRHATFSLAQGKETDFLEYLSTGRMILYFSMAIVTIAGGLLSYFFPLIFKVPSAYFSQSQLLFSIIGFAFAITIPNIVYWSMLYAKQRFDLINISSSVGLVLRAGIIFLLFSVLPKKHITIVTYGLIYFLMVWIQNHMVYLWAKKVLPGIKLSSAHFRIEKVREILSFSVHTSLTRVSLLLYENTANILINLFWGPSFNAIYAVSLKLPSIMKRLFMEPTWTLTPSFTELAAKKDAPRIESLFFMSAKFLSVITIPIVLVLIMMSRPIISTWVGKDFNLAAQIMPIHCLPLFLIIPFAVCGCVNNAYAKVKIPSLLSLLMAVLNVVAGVLLAKYTSLGILGIAIAAACSTFLYQGLFVPYYACKVGNVSSKQFLIESLGKPVLLAVIMLIGYVIARVFGIDRAPLLTMGLYWGSVSALYYFGAYILIFTAKEKAIAQEILSRIITKFNARNARVLDESTAKDY